MSYQQGQNINQFIPHYVVKSDYLPNTRVVEGNNSQTSQLVLSPLYFSFANTKNRKGEEESLPKDQLTSNPTAMPHTKSTKQ